MAGILDTFFGSPDQTQAMGLLGIGLMRGDFGAGAEAAMQHLAGAEDRKLKRGLLAAQIEETKAQGDERKAKIAAAQRTLDQQDRALYGDGGRVSPGAFVPSVDGMGPTMPQGAIAPAGGLMAMARQLGIPEQAIQTDIAFNGGKKLSEFIMERTKPNWQNINGNLVNTNMPGFQGGFQPGMSASNDGRVTMWQPDGQGGLVVGAPRGALETYSAYQGVGEGTKAAFDPVQVIGPDGAARYVPRSTVVGRGPATRPQATFNNPADSDRFAILSQELSRARATGNAVDVAALEREIAGLPPSARAGANPSGLAVPGFQATPTTEQRASAAAAVKQAETDVRPKEERRNDIASGNYMLSVIDQALSHPGRETATGLSGTLDPRNYMPGTNAKGFQAVLEQIRGSTFLQAYQNLKGGGQITEVEGTKAENAIARLSTAQSDGEFVSALKELREVVSGGLQRSGLAAREAGVNPNFPGDNSQIGRKLVDKLPTNVRKGTRARDTTTGQVMVFDGLRWSAEK